MADEKLNEIVKEYAALAKEDKKVDVASLMINALQQQDENRLNQKWKRWAYVLSLTFPPIGFLFGLYYFTKSENDAKSAAMVCIVLTIVSIVATIIFFNVILSSSGTSLQQIQQIKPEQIQEILQ